MPLKDGTGPPDGGPGTGRRLGWCSGQFRRLFENTSNKSTGSKLLTGVVLPIGSAIIVDLVRPNSTIRRLSGALAARLSERKQRMLSNQ